MPQIRISELESTSIGSGDVPIVQNGETLKYDITNKAERATVRTLELTVDSLERAVALLEPQIDGLQSDFNNLSVKYIKEARDINFGSVIIPCSGRITNESKTLSFFVPWAKACAGTYTMKELTLTVRIPDGCFPYVRSGSSGGTYTRLGASGCQVWNNGRTARTNEVDSITVTPVDGSGLRVDIVFNYAIAKASGSATAVTTDIPCSVAKNTMVVTRS